MKTISLLKLGLLLAVGTMVPAGYVEGFNIGINLSPPPVVVYPDTAPPAAVVEAPPPSPGAGFVWINGSWVWGPDHHWIWEKGRWDAPPHAGMHYVPNHYHESGGRHVFERGGWK